MKALSKPGFVVGFLVSAYFASPPIALGLGLALALTVGNPFPEFTRNWSKWLLQVSVVGLGFGMNVSEVLRAGRTGFLYTLIGIVFAVGCGLLLGKALTVKSTPSLLISIGTAICGGSAIAAVGPVLEADEHDMAISLGTVFILNAIALFVFPLVGHSFALSQNQFGLWAALAIHDTSSVVGAAAKYGSVALAVATTVKLTRALWIVPVTLGVALFSGRRIRIEIPWFIFLFLLAAIARSYSPHSAIPMFDALLVAAKVGLAITLFLIGSALSRGAIAEVGLRPLIQGVALWAMVAAASMWFVRSGLL